MINARKLLAQDPEHALDEYEALTGKPEYGDEPELCVKVIKLLLASRDGYVDGIAEASTNLEYVLERAGYVDIECLAYLAHFFLKAYKKDPKWLQMSLSSKKCTEHRNERMEQMRNYLIDMSKSPEAANAKPEIMLFLYDKIAAIDAYLHLVRFGEEQVVGGGTQIFGDSLGIGEPDDSYDMEMSKIYAKLGKSRLHYYGSKEWIAFAAVVLFVAGGAIVGFMVYM